MTSLELVDDHHCFVCGQENPDGLKLTWKTEGHKTRAEFTPQKQHQGWKGITHGGILATVLDEAMTRLAWEIHGKAVTAEMTVRYHKPVPVGENLIVTGELAPSKSRLIPTKAEIKNRKGEVIASATGKAIRQN